MDNPKKYICNRIDRTIGELMRSVDSLYGPAFLFARYNILNQMKCKIQELEFICRLVCSDELQRVEDRPRNSPERVFTRDELGQYDGKGGNPAYVAVNGVVYDVSGNATWAAATHFGLSAGRDLTDAFASCHHGQPVLNKLDVVGKLSG